MVSVIAVVATPTGWSKRLNGRRWDLEDFKQTYTTTFPMLEWGREGFCNFPKGIVQQAYPLQADVAYPHWYDCRDTQEPQSSWREIREGCGATGEGYVKDTEPFRRNKNCSADGAEY